jgi:hypothetical protein
VLPRPDQLWGTPGLLFNEHWGERRSECEADSSPPSSAVVRNSLHSYAHSRCGVCAQEVAYLNLYEESCGATLLQLLQIEILQWKEQGMFDRPDD